LEGVDFGEELSGRIRRARGTFRREYGQYPDTVLMSHETLRAAARSAFFDRVFMYTEVRPREVSAPGRLLGLFWDMAVEVSLQDLPFGTVVLAHEEWPGVTMIVGSGVVGDDVSPTGRQKQENEGREQDTPNSRYRHFRG
jgi:hypothetical protein